MQQQFLKRLGILSLHLLTLSMAVYLRPERGQDEEPGEWDARAILLAGFEVGTLANIMSYLVLQQGGEIVNQGLSSFLKQLVRREEGTLYFISEEPVIYRG